MVQKSIVVLANSYKPGGRCIAGKEVVQKEEGKWKLTDNWIRPVTSNDANHGSIPSRYHYIDRRDVRLLDIVTIDFLRHSPDVGQPENWLIDESMPWKREARFNESVCGRLIDTPADLWVDTAAGVKIHEVSLEYEQAGRMTSSLELIKPKNLEIHLSNDHNPWQGNYKKESKASFSYEGLDYRGISMTDPVLRDALGDQYPGPDQAHVVANLPKGDDYHICVSLSPIFEKTGKHYKLVAAVI